MYAVSLNEGSEHDRACSEFRAERENNKVKTAQVTKDKFTYYKFRVHFFVFGFSR